MFLNILVISQFGHISTEAELDWHRKYSKISLKLELNADQFVVFSVNCKSKSHEFDHHLN